MAHAYNRRMNQGLNVDLHCHSTASDGVLAPADLAARAHANGVHVWSLTDHDELSGQAEAAAKAHELGMRFIPGVEISVTWGNITLHIVGLNVNPTHPGLLNGLRVTRAGRAERARKMGERLAALGMPGAYEGALPYAGNSGLISRTHFARFLVEAGYCPDVHTVFRRYLGDNCEGNVPMQWATLEDAVGWIRAAGGRAVIAHPGRYRYTPQDFLRLYGTFIDLGGTGIEVVTGSHTPKQFREYAKVARRYGFLASRGSDFHSPKESRHDLGKLPPLPDDLMPIWHDWL